MTTGGYDAFFTGSRSIFYSRTAGTHLSYGVVLAKYRSMGYQRSCLGFPTIDPYSIPGGRRGHFVHGYITYTYRTNSSAAVC